MQKHLSAVFHRDICMLFCSPFFYFVSPQRYQFFNTYNVPGVGIGKNNGFFTGIIEFFPENLVEFQSAFAASLASFLVCPNDLLTFVGERRRLIFADKRDDMPRVWPQAMVIRGAIYSYKTYAICLIANLPNIRGGPLRRYLVFSQISCKIQRVF